jgi:hypothetical protein
VAGTGNAAHLISRGANTLAGTFIFTSVEISATQFTVDGFGHSCNTVPIRFSCRWGDYSATQIDPSDTGRAWGFNQLVISGSIGGAGSQFNWNTRGAKVGP